MDSRKLSSLAKGSAQHIYSQVEHRLPSMPALLGSKAVAENSITGLPTLCWSRISTRHWTGAVPGSDLLQ